MATCALSHPSGPSVRRTRTGSASGPLRPHLIQLWRRQIGGRIRLGEKRRPRPFVLIGYQIRGRHPGPVVPLSQLRFYSLFDERAEDDRMATRLLGFRAAAIVTGVHIGGTDASLMEKDLRLPPAASGAGRRIDASDENFLETVLGFERLLERCSRHPHYPRRSTPKFPQWWCETEEEHDLPVRAYHGQRLVELRRAVERGLRIQEMFADLTEVPKRQVLTAPNPRQVLCGTSGETTFDLYASRFRRAGR